MSSYSEYLVSCGGRFVRPDARVACGRLGMRAPASRIPCADRRRRAARVVRAERSVPDVRVRSLRSHATRTSGYRGFFPSSRSLRRAPTARTAPTEATLRTRRTNHASTPVRDPHPRTCDATTATTQVTK